VGEQAKPTLETNTCTGNKEAGIAYFDSSGGTASRNECARNKVGIYIARTARPTLVGNNCYSNMEDNVRDLR
jgi:parallel beta-helix repeat protein